MALFHRKPHFFALLITAATVFTLAGLGVWQVKRLFWKEALIEQIKAANASEPLQAIPSQVGDWDEYRFRKVQFEGTLYPNIAFHLTPRHYKGRLGYHIFSPVLLTPALEGENRVVLVNRGWVSTDNKDAVDIPSPYIPYENQRFTFTGMIRTSVERNPFTPANQPERNVWFGRDVQQMADHANIEGQLLPISIDLLEVTVPDASASVQAVPVSGEVKLMNNHLGYAITWFALAIVAAVIFILYHREKKL